MRVVVELPLPPRALGGNAKSWRRKIVPNKECRQMAKIVCAQAMKDAGCKGFQKATYSITFLTDAIKAKVAGGYAPRDESNALQSCKAYLDGCVDAGIVPDDSRKYLSLGGVTIHSSPDSRKQAGVFIVFSEVSE